MDENMLMFYEELLDQCDLLDEEMISDFREEIKNNENKCYRKTIRILFRE